MRKRIGARTIKQKRATAINVQRVWLLSDTHGVLDERIAALIEADDVVVHGGDIGSQQVLDTLAARAGRLISVRGNNDTATRWSGSEAGRQSLQTQAWLTLPGGDLVAVHGDAFAARHRHDRLRQRYPQARAIFYGHSHRAVIDDTQQPWVLNAGASGRQRTYGGPSCLQLEAGPERWTVQLIRFPSLRP